MKKKAIYLIVLLSLLSFTSATCTLNLDQETYYAQETAIATASCDSGTESNKDYLMNWTYPNGTVLESDSGTTPSGSGEESSETFKIPEE